MNCKECGKETEGKWYLPYSYGAIYPFCSKKCADKHSATLIKEKGYIFQNNDGFLIVDTGTNGMRR